MYIEECECNFIEKKCVVVFVENMLLSFISESLQALLKNMALK